MKWTNDEIQMLRDNVNLCTVRELSEKLSKGKDATRSKIKRIGLTGNFPHENKAQSLLEKNCIVCNNVFHVKSYRKDAKYCSWDCAGKGKKFGYSKFKTSWSKEEDDILLNYISYTAKQLSESGLLTRTESAIYSRRKVKGIKKNKIWVVPPKEELSLLYDTGFSLEKIADKYGVSLTAVINRFKKYNIPLRKRADQNSLAKLDLNKWEFVEQWKPKTTPDLYYVLGILKGDGDVSVQWTKAGTQYKVELTSTDRIFVENFIIYLKKIGISHSGWIFTEKKKNKNWNTAYKTRASCKVFTDWYKTTSLEWIQKNASTDEHKLMFIKGMYESEGSLLNNNGCHCIEIINSNKQLLKMVYNFINELGFHPTFRQTKRIKKREKDKSDIYKIGMYRDKEVQDLLKLITSCIPRKASLYGNSDI